MANGDLFGRFFIVKIEELPNDIDALKKLLIEKNQQILELKDIITLLQRKKFAPTSEASKDQLQLFNELEDIVDCENKNEDESKSTEVKPHTRTRGKRAPLPENLRRVDEVYDIDEDKKDGMKCIGEEISEQLIIEPATIYIRRTIRKKYAPIDINSDQKLITASAPEKLLPKTMASSSLIAYIITAKYVDALPLYRQEKIFERVHASLTRQTMARWLIQVSEKLMPLYNLLQDKCLEKNYLQMDETRVQVLNEEGKKSTSKSYMWLRLAHGDNPIILYDYAPTRAGSVPIELLEGFSGALQIDGYDGYAAACEKFNLERLGCMDHCRRKFFDASKTSNGKNIGTKGVKFFKQLYKIEEQIEKLSADERHRIRQEKSVPLLAEIKAWINEVRDKITPGSVAGKAINYAYNEWEYLEKYTRDPKYNISNILIENAVRPFAIGRKNWLFCASTDGAKASAMYYSIIETAKKNGFEPFDYLSKMLDKLPSAKTVEDFEKLLPLRDSFKY